MKACHTRSLIQCTSIYKVRRMDFPSRGISQQPRALLCILCNSVLSSTKSDASSRTTEGDFSAEQLPETEKKLDHNHELFTQTQHLPVDVLQSLVNFLGLEVALLLLSRLP